MRIAAVVLVASLAISSTALASARFTDPRGDAGGNGPDITSVTLSHTDASVTIAVQLASTPPLGHSDEDRYTDMLLIGIHTGDDLGRRTWSSRRESTASI